MTKLTVYYDGACPLCAREIAFLKRLDRRRRIAFEDVAEPGAGASCPVESQRLLARFHARLPDGQLVDGARAFTETYAQIPGLGPVKWLGRFGPSRAVLNLAYAGFLTIRPGLQRLARRRAA
jgi:predicted DCC family thiol-disulfide oxidoreductase YuxK